MPRMKSRGAAAGFSIGPAPDPSPSVLRAQELRVAKRPTLPLEAEIEIERAHKLVPRDAEKE